MLDKLPPVGDQVRKKAHKAHQFISNIMLYVATGMCGISMYISIQTWHGSVVFLIMFRNCDHYCGKLLQQMT